MCHFLRSISSFLGLAFMYDHVKPVWVAAVWSQEARLLSCNYCQSCVARTLQKYEIFGCDATLIRCFHHFFHGVSHSLRGNRQQHDSLGKPFIPVAMSVRACEIDLTHSKVSLCIDDVFMCLRIHEKEYLALVDGLNDHSFFSWL